MGWDIVAVDGGGAELRGEVMIDRRLGLKSPDMSVEDRDRLRVRIVECASTLLGELMRVLKKTDMRQEPHVDRPIRP